MMSRAQPLVPRPTGRDRSIDALRGFVMIVMALDHVRDMVGTAGVDALAVGTASPGLFMTRWVTHVCAPVFVLLAGVSVSFMQRRRTDGAGLSRFLLVRGAWLILLEFTVVRLAWYFELSYTEVFAQVIWAIGVSMLVLALLVHLPRWVSAALAVATIGGHNLLEGASPAAGGIGEIGWQLFYGGGWFTLGSARVFALYAVLPWVGVMALGYAVGPFLSKHAGRRNLAIAGLALVAVFVVLRIANGYGDPSPWSPQSSGVRTAMSFLNVTKYPASLQFLAITLGLSALVLVALRSEPLRSSRITDWLEVFGRVPLFYYIVHLYVIHAVAVAIGAATGFDPAAFFVAFDDFPRGYGLSLLGVYAIWAAIVLALYPLCRWYAGVKRRSTSRWLRYL